MFGAAKYHRSWTPHGFYNYLFNGTIWGWHRWPDQLEYVTIG